MEGGAEARAQGSQLCLELRVPSSASRGHPMPLPPRGLHSSGTHPLPAFLGVSLLGLGWACAGVRVTGPAPWPQNPSHGSFRTRALEHGHPGPQINSQGCPEDSLQKRKHAVRGAGVICRGPCFVRRPRQNPPKHPFFPKSWTPVCSLRDRSPSSLTYSSVGV